MSMTKFVGFYAAMVALLFAAGTAVDAQPTVNLTSLPVFVSPTGSDAADGLTSATAKATIAGAIAVQSGRDSLAIAAGTYTGVNLFPSTNTFQIQGGWDADFAVNDPDANVTTINGNGTDSIFNVTGGNNLLIHGLTLNGGGGTDSGDGSPKDGGAIFSDGDNDIITIQRCRFTNNVATDDGGAAFFNSIFESITFDYCYFSGNSATDDGGIVNFEAGTTVTFSNCTFENNSGSDQLINNDSGTFFRMRDCVFSNNTVSSSNGRPIYVRNRNDITVAIDALLSNCTISGNTVTNVGGDNILKFEPRDSTSPHTLVIESCLFDDNTVGNSFLVHADTGTHTAIFRNNVLSRNNIGVSSNSNSLVELEVANTLHFVNNTIIDNVLTQGSDTDSYLRLVLSAPVANVARAINNVFSGNSSDENGGIFGSSSASAEWTTIENNIFYNNAFDGANAVNNPGAFGVPGSSTAVTFGGRLTGNGNFDQNPGLSPFFPGNHLLAGSLARDAGQDLPGLVDDDYDGDTRPLDARTDIGADEFGPNNPPLPQAPALSTRVQEWMIYY